MRKKILIMLLFVMMLFSACREEPGHPQVVNRVEVDCHHAGVDIRRSYIREESMEAVLNYLRLQRDLGRAETDPERLTGDVFEVRVYLSNGEVHVYRQRGEWYLSKDCHPWKKVEPRQERSLYHIIWQYRSEEEIALMER